MHTSKNHCKSLKYATQTYWKDIYLKYYIFFSYQSSSLNRTLSINCLKGTSLLRFGKKAIFGWCMNYCCCLFVFFVVFCCCCCCCCCFVFWYDSHVVLFFHLLTNFTKDLPIDRPHPHPDLPFLFLKCCNTLSNVHSTDTETFGDQNDCNPHAFHLWTVRKTGSFLLLYLWRQKHSVTPKWSMRRECTTG